MAEVTVKQLADTVGTPVEKLLQQLKDAGVEKSAAEDTIEASEKSQLLTFLRQSQGVEKKSAGTSKITLKRKTRGEIKVGGPGKRAVTVETRGNRTYAKRNDAAREEMVRQAALRQAQAEKDESNQVADAARNEVRDKELEEEKVKRDAEDAVCLLYTSPSPRD